MGKTIVNSRVVALYLPALSFPHRAVTSHCSYKKTRPSLENFRNRVRVSGVKEPPSTRLLNHLPAFFPIGFCIEPLQTLRDQASQGPHQKSFL